MKETHPAGSDRNTASPTESAVCGWPGSGTLRSRLPELYHIYGGRRIYLMQAGVQYMTYL